MNTHDDVVAELRRTIAELERKLELKTHELSEAHQQQAATADILRVIGRTAFDLSSVMNALTSSASDLCEAEGSALLLREGDLLIGHGVSHVDQKMADFLRQTPVALNEESFLGRAVLHGTVANIGDVESTIDKTRLHVFRRTLGHKAILIVPLMKEGRGIGAFALTRMRVGPFSERQVELVQTFADQALIAIEIFRLFDEVRGRTRELAASLDELRTAQDRLVQSEKLAALGRLVAGVAHEVNSPVGTSLTVASSLERRIELFADEFARGPLRRSSLNDLIDSGRAATTQLVTNLNRAADLIQSFKQVAADGTHTEQREFDLRETTNQIILGLAGVLRRAPVTVSVEIPLGLTVNSYPGCYGQILTNLFLNAIHHAFPQGRAGTIRIAARLDANRDIELAFADDGIGMTTDVRRQAFDPFFTTRRNEGGTGLGLHIVHNVVVQQLGGRISLESAPEEGTAFHILIPGNMRRSPDPGGPTDRSTTPSPAAAN